MTAEASGLLVRGRGVEIPGLTVFNRADFAWCRLDSMDYRKRRGTGLAWIRQVTVHTTKGTWPHHTKPGAGPGGRDKSVAEYWSITSGPDAHHGGAHIVVDNDGSIASLADVVLDEAYHATTVNPWSIGIEMYQEADGGIYQAVLESTVRLVDFLCNGLDDAAVGVPFQVPSRKYNNDAMDRMKYDGGPSMAGVFGHRDNAWDFAKHTSSRGRGDPGEEVYLRLIAAGAEAVDYVGRWDVMKGRNRQAHLNAMTLSSAPRLVVDGMVGPASIRRSRELGFRSWVDVPETLAA